MGQCHGVLLGQAVGDALGTTVEFASEESIRARSSADGWPGKVVGKGPFSLKVGQVTDDTELALCLARSLAAEGRYDDEQVAAAYVRWLASGPVDHGNATARAFTSHGLPRSGVAAAIRARADGVTQANGSLMRVSPLGLFGHALPRHELAELAARDSTLSHPSEVCQAACAVFTATIAEALHSERTGEELCAWALEFAGSSALTRPVAPWLEEAAKASEPPFKGDRRGWVRLAFELAYFHLGHAKDFESALIQVVRAGGDTDTNGAIAGALLGAHFGEAAIPAQWKEAVLGCVPARPKEYHCTDLLELSEQLAGLHETTPR